MCAPPPPQQPLPLLRPVCTAAGVLGSGQHFWQRSRSQFQDCTTCRLKRLTQRGATPPHPSPWRAERAAGARLRGDAVVGPATVHGIWTAIPRRPGVFVILGSRNVPAQATDSQAHARPAPVAGKGGRAQNLYAMPLHATALSMVSGQRFYVGPACSSYSDRATCRLKRPTPLARARQRQSLCRGGGLRT